MTVGDKIALVALIVTITFGLVGGGWAIYTWRRRHPPSQPRLESTSAVSDRIDGGSVASPQPQVSWRIEYRSGATYALRNIGTDTAEHVSVDASRAPAINRRLPVDASMLPNEAVDIMLKGSMQSRMPNQLYLRWEGQPEWAAVPIP